MFVKRCKNEIESHYRENKNQEHEYDIVIGPTAKDNTRAELSGDWESWMEV